MSGKVFLYKTLTFSSTKTNFCLELKYIGENSSVTFHLTLAKLLECSLVGQKTKV